jgi:hypothetical protein
MHCFNSCGILKSQTYFFFLFSQVVLGCKPTYKHKTKGNEASTRNENSGRKEMNKCINDDKYCA